MTKRISVVAVGSPVHPPMQRVAILEKLVSVLEKSGFDINMISEPITSIDEAWAIRHKVLELQDPLLILHLTGGTSKIAVEVAKWSNSPVTLIAHGESNSLPSSLEACTRLRCLGLDVEVKFVKLNGAKLELEDRKVVFEKCMTILGDVAPRTFDVTCPATLAQRLKVRIKHLAHDELEKYVEKYRQSTDLIQRFLSEFKGEVQVPQQELQLSLAFKEAVSDILEKTGCNIFTVDCFEVIKRIHVTPCLAISLLAEKGILGICEADIQAAACMISIRELGHPFMGNIVVINEEDESLVLAHCTAAITLALSRDRVKLKSHFETDKSVAVDVPLRLGDSVMISCDPQLKEAYLAECHVDKSQLENRNMCRTQVLLKLKSKPSKILASWPSGHAVLAIQASIPEVRRTLEKKGFTIREL
ncbi:MAG: hypothetical protein ACXQTB_01760 [Candidatus Nezhaarchaeales archaeon]